MASAFCMLEDPDVVDDQAVELVLKTRLARAMVCIRVWLRIGLSR